MRILDKGGVALDFDALGFDGRHARARSCDVLDAAARHPARHRPDRLGQDDDALHRARPSSTQPDVKIITVEDPVEYQMRGHQPDPGQAADRPHVRQRAALDRAPGPGRHHDRRDPRPRDRADRRAVGAHRPPRAVDACTPTTPPSTVTRLLDMGVEDYLLTSTVIGILAQRLVRKLCPHCKEPYTALPEVVEQFGPAPASPPTATSRSTTPKGCPQCCRHGLHRAASASSRCCR